MSKYYSTQHILRGMSCDFRKKYNIPQHISQFRIACKAKSRAEADRIVMGILNSPRKIFLPQYTTQTENQDVMRSCDKYVAIIQFQSFDDNYYSLQHIMNDINNLK